MSQVLCRKQELESKGIELQLRTGCDAHPLGCGKFARVPPLILLYISFWFPEFSLLARELYCTSQLCVLSAHTHVHTHLIRSLYSVHCFIYTYSANDYCVIKPSLIYTLRSRTFQNALCDHPLSIALCHWVSQSGLIAPRAADPSSIQCILLFIMRFV